MGQEALTTVTIADASGSTLLTAHDVHVLLESGELILRGPLVRRFGLAHLVDAAATADLLRFTVGDERVEIELPPATARRWAGKITAPPPSLAQKLGISGAAPLVIGQLTDHELLAAVAETDAGASTASATNASRASSSSPAAVVAIAEIDDEADLLAALHARPPGMPLWLIHRKGQGEWMGDAAIRSAMRSRGFVDTKVSAVSAARTATRYVERQPQPPPESS